MVDAHNAEDVWKDHLAKFIEDVGMKDIAFVAIGAVAEDGIAIVVDDLQ